MRSAVSAVLIAGVASQVNGASFGTTSFGTTSSSPSLTLGAASLPSSTLTTAGSSSSTGTSTSSGTATTRGLPIGTVNGIQDSDVVCAENGGTGAACGLQNVASIYNPNPALRYQTQYSDNAVSLIQATNCYNAAGQRIVGQNAACNGNTYNIPTQNAAASGVVTTTANGIPLSSTTNWLNNGALANYITPSASNAVLPNSVAFAQANLAPQTTTPVNTLTGAGFGYSTLLGQTAGSVSTPVISGSPVTYSGSLPYSTGFGSSYNFGSTIPSFSNYGSSLPLSSYSSLPLSSYSSVNSYSSLPLSSYSPVNSYSSLPLSSYSPVNSYSSLPLSSYSPVNSYSPFSSYSPISTGFSSGLSTGYFPSSSYVPSYNPAAQPFTNAYSAPGVLGAPSQAGIVRH